MWIMEIYHINRLFKKEDIISIIINQTQSL